MVQGIVENSISATSAARALQDSASASQVSRASHAITTLVADTGIISQKVGLPTDAYRRLHPPGKPDGWLYCNCTHLTEFGGVNFPFSAEELLAEFTSIKFTVFTLDDIANVLGNFDIAGNPEIFTLLAIITVMDVLMIVCNKFRYHRRILRRGRAAISRRKELRKNAKAKQKARGNDDDALAQRRLRRQSTAGPLAMAEQRKKNKKRQPPIQDRIFLDLLSGPSAAPAQGTKHKKLPQPH